MPAKVESMSYTQSGGVPWHGLGQPVTDEMTPEQMAEAAGIAWTVSKRNLAYANGESQLDGMPVWHQIPKEFALCRDTDNQFLSFVGDGYKPVQNLEAMDFFKKFVAAGHMKMETAGSLKRGKFIWGLAKIEKTLNVAGKKDPVEGYMLLSQPHALGHALLIQTTAVRVVCWNTFTAALGAGLKGKGNAFRMSHSGTFDDSVKKAAEEALGLATTQLDEFEQAANVLAKAKAKDEDVLLYFENVMRTPKVSVESGRESRIITQLEEAHSTAPGQTLASAKGTWWGAFNAVTYCVDHSFGRDRDFTMARAWLGNGANQKRRALQLALDCADGKPLPTIKRGEVKEKVKVAA